MKLLTAFYSGLSLALFVIASVRRAPPAIIVQVALCFALGNSVRIALDHGGESAFWLLVLFGPLLVFPVIELAKLVRGGRQSEGE